MFAPWAASTASATMSSSAAAAAAAAAAAIPPIMEVAAPDPAPVLSPIWAAVAVAIRRILRLLITCAWRAALSVVLIPRWCGISVVRRRRAHRVDTLPGARAALALRGCRRRSGVRGRWRGRLDAARLEVAVTRFRVSWRPCGSRFALVGRRRFGNRRGACFSLVAVRSVDRVAGLACGWTSATSATRWASTFSHAMRV
jgi:hypothetical protein